MTSCVRQLAFAPLLLGTLGACLPALAPGIRPVGQHVGMTTQTDNDTCMGCHEAEQRVSAQLASMSVAKREAAMQRRMQGGGASLVAQWMLEDPRACAACHEPRRGLR